MRDERGRWASGQSGNPNGRPRGTPNRTTASLKEALLNAFDEAGGEGWLVALARSDPRTFAGLLGRLIPREVQAQIEGGPPDMAELILAARKRHRAAAAKRKAANGKAEEAGA